MIDERDWDILQVLQDNGRATYAEIGTIVGMAASSVHERVRKLEQRGVITKYGPVIDPIKLGLGLLAYVSLYAIDSCREIANQVQDWPEIEEFHSVAGEQCALLKVRVADTEALEDFLERLRLVTGVQRTRSTVVLKTRWDGRRATRTRLAHPDA